MSKLQDAEGEDKGEKTKVLIPKTTKQITPDETPSLTYNYIVFLLYIYHFAQSRNISIATNNTPASPRKVPDPFGSPAGVYHS